ncbi:hypothetical protein OHA_1_03838 [Pleomorphomonas sp. SM30]|uniref:Uncharacterized protein n=2 Tax=Oharaeibacter diazotrophicus TaxID=1920512 RepID=A0A4R6RFW2_9HYPH|nr:hypothetical protein [Oharaeibacter diazotrophicus]TDP85239.1 hypothetical protein EDD54_2088 [Oharaeibacter diazotrophicus]BBE74209.1 hypothetical protein OHA_1_03838 [Pleomorphomonas sp. SM30]GLS76103.1 hypothetical protein GCM10007904_14380 [Oharaeibacter diazotrophicus]
MATGEGGDERARRLAEALRANLKRRKAQAKSRRAGEADGRAGLPAAGIADVDAAGESADADSLGDGAAAPER